MKRLLPLLCIVVSMWASAAEDVLRLPIGRDDDVYTLSPFEAVHLQRHYFGEYIFPNEHTGGTKLHLFPNGRFVISEWVDVSPDELKAAGSYKVRGDRLTLQFNRVAPGSEELKNTFADLHILWGWIAKEDYVTGFEVFVFTAEGWETLKSNPGRAKYLQRETVYNDWEKILRDYESRKR